MDIRAARGPPQSHRVQFGIYQVGMSAGALLAGMSRRKKVGHAVGPQVLMARATFLR